MPRKVIWIGLMISIVLFFLILTVHFYTEGYRHYAIINTMTESAQTAEVESLDKSSRIDPTVCYMDTTEFENKFEALFKKNVNVKLKKESFAFSFLNDSGDIKAVSITVTDDRNIPYHRTYRTDVAGND
ncbi:hypothetical protein [Sporolactobacillus sp. KGMB 08714]|uniref:hypothetical protein n=1 Tax=Sporolactobacillus sp. KGMB 08714 TaxID=3064704 RepID=UPI002FBD640D